MKTTVELTREAGGFDATPEFLERLVALVRADERERLYGKDIDTLLFEEHQLAFEKGRRSEREACAKVCESEWSNVAERMYGEECAAAIRARGNT